jgi:hypothetical protein
MRKDNVTVRAFEKLREDGVIALIDSGLHYLTNRYKYFKRKWAVRKRHFLMKRRYDAVTDPYKIVTVDPDQITKSLAKPLPSWYDGKWSMYGRIQDGNWDIECTHPFEEKENYQAMQSHFLEGVPWKKSGIIDHYWGRVQTEDRNSIHGCQTREELLNYYEGIDGLFAEIQENGFRKIPRTGRLDPRDYDVVSVHIDRHGVFIFSGSGNHRLCIAKILEIDKIPVRILGRHEQWQELRDEIHNNSLPDSCEGLHDHPDLQDVLD